jgi:hypothetical protein
MVAKSGTEKVPKAVKEGQWVFVFVWEMTETAILCSKSETAWAYASEFLLAWCKALKDDEDYDEEAKDVRGLIDEGKVTEAVKAWAQVSGGMIFVHPVVEQKKLDRKLVVLERE